MTYYPRPWSQPFDIRVDDQTVVRLQVTEEAMRTAERFSGKPWREIVSGARAGSVTALAWYCFAAARHLQPDFTFDRAAEVLDVHEVGVVLRLTLREESAGRPH